MPSKQIAEDRNEAPILLPARLSILRLLLLCSARARLSALASPILLDLRLSSLRLLLLRRPRARHSASLESRPLSERSRSLSSPRARRTSLASRRPVASSRGSSVAGPAA